MRRAPYWTKVEDADTGTPIEGVTAWMPHVTLFVHAETKHICPVCGKEMPSG